MRLNKKMKTDIIKHECVKRKNVHVYNVSLKKKSGIYIIVSDSNCKAENTKPKKI